MLIDGRPTVIVSAEFHYFRVPDRERWRPLLIAIKGAGFNAVRLYFHWGYHAPAEGVFNFRGNRDIDFLLAICADLHLFVIAAPGPYICAEVQGGGFPLWLVAKRHLRIRHMKYKPIGVIKQFDDEFHEYCVAYLRKIMSILVRYERTNVKDGPIILLQIENELREKTFGLGGLDDELRRIAEVARQSGSTVPFFHNDDNPIGSWSSGRPGKDGPTGYRTDMYGFDLYFTFPPGDKSGDRSSMQCGMIELCGVSACINLCGVGGVGMGGSDTKCMSCLYYQNLKHAPPPPAGWAKAGQMPPATDKLERNFDKMGGSAENCPTICAELQVGWINQWGRLRGYDDTYNFFGHDFSATLHASMASQGVNIVNHYMAYGGTNHGSVGDTEVYTSYDYSAFIREFGMLCARGRRLRQISLFVRSFAQSGLASSEPLRDAASNSKARPFARIKSTLPGSLVTVREANFATENPLRTGVQPPMYAFLRNLSGGDSARFNLILDDAIVPVYLPVNQALIAPLYHPLPVLGWSIFASSVPVICRTRYMGAEMWVLRTRESEVGHLVFRVDPGATTAPAHSIAAQWALLQAPSNGADSDGEIRASDMDQGAATSFLSAPLEELPLSQFDIFGDSRAPIAMRASTESVGLCFSMAFAGKGTTVVSVRVSDASQPMLRLVCLTERDSDKFTADLSREDPYQSPRDQKGYFSAAWGVSELAFTPQQKLEVHYGGGHTESAVYMLRENAGSSTPEQFTRLESKTVQQIVPNLFVHQIARESVPAALQHGISKGNPMDRGFELELENWQLRQLDWADDINWKAIDYSQRDPLDHSYTSGHIAYRLRFKASTRHASIVLNIRHVAVVWCNGQVIGRQICYSHNAMSAGSMHAVDLHHAGKKRHSLSKALKNDIAQSRGYDEVIILVFSCGQSRAPFFLNDVRNRRGLLSAKLKCRAKVQEAQWYIGGVDMTRSDDAFSSSGFALEDVANDLTHEQGFGPVTSLSIAANAGVAFFRSTFKTPANSVMGGSVLYPLRLKLFSAPGVVAMLWVNGLLIGRYVADLGPQSDFYVPQGLITSSKNNSVVVAAYGDMDSTLSVKLVPWVVDPISGNIDDAGGEVFAQRRASFSLEDVKTGINAA